MRILITSYYKVIAGGAVKVSRLLAKGLAQNFGQHYCIDYLINELDPEDRNELMKYVSNIFQLTIRKLILFCLDKLKHYDLVIINGYRNLFTLLICMFCKFYRIPYVINTHGTTFLIREAEPNILKLTKKRIFDILIGKKILNWSSLIVGISEIDKENIEKLGLSSSKISVIYNPIDLEQELKYNLQQKPISNLEMAKFNILYIGILHKQKGIDVLLKAFKKLDNSYHLRIVGPDQGYKNNILKIISKEGIKNVEVLPPMREKEKFTMFRWANVIVYTAKFEGFGYVPFEGLLNGVVSIVSRDTGCGFIISKNKIGYVVPYGDVYALIDAIKHVRTNPEEVNEMIQRGRKFIYSNLSLDHIATKWHHNISSILKRNQNV